MTNRIRIVVVTMDGHFAPAMEAALADLARDLPQVSVALHTADEWADDPVALAACLADIAGADIVVAAMLFLDEHARWCCPRCRRGANPAPPCSA
jgi:magnesium chelatase subunit H